MSPMPFTPTILKTSLRFERPQVDTCITCEELFVKIKSPILGPNAKKAADAELVVHKRRAKKFHNKIAAVKEICKSYKSLHLGRCYRFNL